MGLSSNAQAYLLPEAGAESVQRRLEAVRCTPWLRLSKNPQTEKIGAHNSFIFQSHFSVKMPELDFFDSPVRR
jgi:hypothetical protein